MWLSAVHVYECWHTSCLPLFQTQLIRHPHCDCYKTNFIFSQNYSLLLFFFFFLHISFYPNSSYCPWITYSNQHTPMAFTGVPLQSLRYCSLLLFDSLTPSFPQLLFPVGAGFLPGFCALQMAPDRPNEWLIESLTNIKKPLPPYQHKTVLTNSLLKADQEHLFRSIKNDKDLFFFSFFFFLLR